MQLVVKGTIQAISNILYLVFLTLQAEYEENISIYTKHVYSETYIYIYICIYCNKIRTLTHSRNDFYMVSLFIESDNKYGCQKLTEYSMKTMK